MEEKKTYNKIVLDAPSTFLNPVPVVMLSCRGTTQGFDNDNVITIAWTGTINSTPPMLSVSIRKSRHSHRQISESMEFVVNLVNEELLQSCDYCGVKSGSNVDKFEVCKFTKEKANGLEISSAIKNSPVSISCKVTQIIELGSHDMFLAEIVAVTVADTLLNSEGKIDLCKAKLVVYSHGDYCSLKEIIGFFGFSVAGEEVLKRRMPKRKDPVSAAKTKPDIKTDNLKADEDTEFKFESRNPIAKQGRTGSSKKHVRKNENKFDEMKSGDVSDSKKPKKKTRKYY